MFGAAGGIGFGVEVDEDEAFFPDVGEVDLGAVLVRAGEVGGVGAGLEGIGVGGGEEEGGGDADEDEGGDERFVHGNFLRRWMDGDGVMGKLRAVAGWRWKYAWRDYGGGAMSVGIGVAGRVKTRTLGWMKRLSMFLASVMMVAAAEPDAADKRVVQTVQRLASFDYAKANVKTKEAIGRYLTATAGSEEYFRLVEKFRVSEQRDVLLGLAGGGSGGAAAGQAVKLLYQLGEGAAVTAAVAGLPGEKAAGLVEVLAGVGSRETAEAAFGFLAKADAAAAVREAAVKGLGRHGEGQKLLLESAKGGTLPAAVRDAVAAVLATATDEAIRTEAATVIPMVAEVKLAPVSELAKRTGDVTKGQVVYMTYCFTCHQVNGVGVDFGPALSEIGSKLAKEAMYDAILNPSAGISFGFEGWEVTMKDGTVWTGMIASETDAEVSLKVPGGILQKCAKGEITGRKKLAVSLMTPKLGTVIPEADLVDLVEYLGSLKKKP